MNHVLKPLAGLCLAAFATMSLSAHAALYDRGNGMVYDDALDITWLANANLAFTSGYDDNNFMNWDQALAWADQLVHGGFDDWRLLSALNQDSTGPCLHYGCSDSEIGHLWHVDFGLGYGDVLADSTSPNVGLFQNISTIGGGTGFWTGTVVQGQPTKAWAFGMSDGYQYSDFMTKQMRTWAVRDGDVTAVPEPETYALMLAGLGLVGFAARRRRV